MLSGAQLLLMLTMYRNTAGPALPHLDRCSNGNVMICVHSPFRALCNLVQRVTHAQLLLCHLLHTVRRTKMFNI